MNYSLRRGGVVLLLGLMVGCPAEEGPRTTPGDAAPAVENKPEAKEHAVAGTNTKTIWNTYVVYPDGDEQLAGQLAVERGMLRVVAAEDEENREYLDGVVENVNALDELLETVSPGDDEPRYTLKAKVYTRDDPDFERVLADTLRTDHALRVEPAN